MKPNMQGEIPLGDEQLPPEFGYEQALEVLEGFDAENLTHEREGIMETCDFQNAIEKSKQAIRDCLELGLNGIGE